MEIHIVPHARQRMAQRGITAEDIRLVLEDPQLTRPGNQPGRTVYERKIREVVAVVTVDNTQPIKVVSVWKRSK